MLVPLPKPLCQKISNQAVKYARQEINGYGWSDKSIQALQDMTGEGLVGIRLSSKYFHYLMLQERGVNHPWLMWWVEGRTLPMGCKMGDGPHFRRGGHVGESGWVDIPHKPGPGPGGKTWRDERWKHPGLKPRNFMHNGLRKAVNEAKPEIEAYARKLFKGIAE